MSKPKPAVPIIYRHREQRRRERLRGFNPGVRDAIAELTCCSQEAEDLADSFPGLLYALVTGFGTPSAREACFNHVLEGKSLRLAAAALGLPYWTRRLPPQAFSEPLCNLPSSADFDSRISHLIPSSRILVRPWLDRILCAYHVCGEEFAIWVGRNLRLPLPEATDESFTFLTAWAWHSITLEAPGHALLNRPWTSKMSLRRAEEEVVKWRRRLSLSYSLGNGLPNAWLNAGVVGEFEFVPLLTAQDFIRESEAMDNCLDQYSDRMASGGIRVFSIRREGVPVADIELGPIARQSHLPTIVQIKAARNRPAPLAVWRAAHAWLKGHGDVPLPRRPGALKIGERRQAMRRIWVPYFAHLPERMLPSLAALLAREPLVRQSSRRLLPSDCWLFPDRFLPIGTDPVSPAPATAFTDDGDVSGTS
ncbi:MAG: PcfJ domain-containing protein [Hyphomicrobiaceae bacterium]|nr:PcfJ domain-containing protein [Hyphomicrobiaceae bacterium]